MKKCKKCGTLQSDEKTTCLDCGTLLGRPMTEEEEEAADELLDDRLDDLSERMQDFYVPLRDKIMGVISIIGIIAAFVLLGIAGGEKAVLNSAHDNTSIWDRGQITVDHYTTDDGYSYTSITNLPVPNVLRSPRVKRLEQASASALIGIIALIGAFPTLLFPRLMWRLGTFKYRFFYDWDPTPSEFGMIVTKLLTYFLFVIGVPAVLYGWYLYLF